MNNFKISSGHTTEPLSFTSFQSPSLTSHISHSDYFNQSAYSSIRINDPKQQLLRRWQTLGQQMINKEMSRDIVIALDRTLDQVEGMLLHKIPLGDHRRRNARSRGLEILQLEDSGIDVDLASETTPPASGNIGSSRGGKNNSIDSAILLERLKYAVKQIQDRRQDVRNLHDMIALQAKEDSKNIMQLESQRDQLKQDLKDDETELTYLKLQLRIIEIQTLPYVPNNDQNDLALGIQKWKLDWADVSKRYRKREWKRALDRKHDMVTGWVGENMVTATNVNIGDR